MYFEMQIKEGGSATIKCPDPNCLGSPLPTEIQLVVSPSLFAKYDEKLLEATLASMADVVLCPRPACQQAVIVEDVRVCVCLCVCLCVCACVCICVYVCVYACVSVSVSVCHVSPCTHLIPYSRAWLCVFLMAGLDAGPVHDMLLLILHAVPQVVPRSEQMQNCRLFPRRGRVSLLFGSVCASVCLSVYVCVCVCVCVCFDVWAPCVGLGLLPGTKQRMGTPRF